MCAPIPDVRVLSFQSGADGVYLITNEQTLALQKKKTFWAGLANFSLRSLGDEGRSFDLRAVCDSGSSSFAPT